MTSRFQLHSPFGPRAPIPQHILDSPSLKSPTRVSLPLQFPSIQANINSLLPPFKLRSCAHPRHLNSLFFRIRQRPTRRPRRELFDHQYPALHTRPVWDGGFSPFFEELGLCPDRVFKQTRGEGCRLTVIPTTEVAMTWGKMGDVVERLRNREIHGAARGVAIFEYM